MYALDVGHLALAPERIPEYEKIALFKERARAILQNGNFAVEIPARVYEFYHLDESDYTVMASEKKRKTIEVVLWVYPFPLRVTLPFPETIFFC